MQLSTTRSIWNAGLATLVASATSAQAAPTIWDGPLVTFTRPALVDGSDPAYQDFLTENVSIARGSTAGLYNAAVESFYNGSGPTDTAWAFGTTADLGSLTFDTWVATVAPNPPTVGPPQSVGREMVLHLISDDIYIDLMFTSWGQGFAGGGAFSYQRSTPGTANIPEPSTAMLIVAGGVGLLILRTARTVDGGCHRPRRGIRQRLQQTSGPQ